MEKVRKFCYKGEFLDVDLASSSTIRECAREFLRVKLVFRNIILEIP